MLHRRESVNSTSSDPSPTGIENVYEKLTFIFERDYGSTLRSVQYKNIRTSEMNVISSLPIRPTRHGSIASTNTMNETNTPWEGTVSTSIVSDPSEWHTGVRMLRCVVLCFFLVVLCYFCFVSCFESMIRSNENS